MGYKCKSDANLVWEHIGCKCDLGVYMACELQYKPEQKNNKWEWNVNKTLKLSLYKTK